VAAHTHPSGTKFYSNTSGTTYVEVGDLISIQVPDLEKKHSDDTDLSTTGKQEVTSPSWQQASDAEAVVYFAKAQYTTLKAFFDNETIVNWRTTYPLLSGESVNSKHEWPGYISKIAHSKIEKLSDDKLSVPVTIRRTSVVTFAAGT
jgi:hypothetical protein